ncbi:MAG: small ribosomal subunit biogenesis GTPase RsgA [Halomonadaceae bacterium]|nr:MAG: small ribosomal subunit biogenesis GTPase RsgA [Halomonadaceae bacterium]
MAKRKLSHQQRRRIAAMHQERRQKAADQTQQQAGEGLAEESEGIDLPGLVMAHYGQQLAIRPLSPGSENEEIRCHARANIDPLVTGDRVVWRRGDDNRGIVLAREPRDSVLKRPDNFGNLKPVAANIDRMLVVIAPLPEPHDNLIDRYLAAAEISGIEPVLVLNKQDLMNPARHRQLDPMLARYRVLGYQVLAVSADGEPQHEAGMETLRGALQGHTSVLAGQSGVGKSSLVQQLLPEESLRIGDLSEAGKGTHTTTTARLYSLAGGGSLIDSPGIREFGLWHITAQELAWGFVDIRPLAGMCRFRNCSHLNEPGCALDEAQEQGKLSPERLNSFRRILRDMASQQARGLTPPSA